MVDGPSASAVPTVRVAWPLLGSKPLEKAKKYRILREKAK